MEKNKDRLEKIAPDLASMAEFWHDTADFMEGENAVILAGTRYMPKFPDETADEYAFRQSNAKLTNIYRDIVEGLAAKPFERAVAFVDPPAPGFVEFADDVDGSGNNHTIFAMDYFFNAIANGVDLLFIDHPTVDPKLDPVTGSPMVRTLDEERALGLRPYWSRINILNVREIVTSLIKGRELISYMRVFEPETAMNPKQIREMKREPDTGRAWWQLWVWDKKADDYLLGPSGEFSIGYIPVVPLHLGRRKGKQFKYYPPMRDALSLQKKLFRSESNLEVTKVYTAHPMLVGRGVSPEKQADGKTPKKLIRGPGITLYAPFTGAGNQTDWGFIEPAGQSLTFLQNDIDKSQQALREIGKQPLTATSGNLTTITTAVAAGKAKSAVKAWAAGLSDALTMAYWFTAMWMRAEQSAPKVRAYDEFDEFIEPGKDVDALLAMSRDGKISDETLWSEMTRRNILSADFEPETEKQRLLAQLPGNGIDNNPNDNFNP